MDTQNAPTHNATNSFSKTKDAKSLRVYVVQCFVVNVKNCLLLGMFVIQIIKNKIEFDILKKKNKNLNDKR